MLKTHLNFILNIIRSILLLEVLREFICIFYTNEEPNSCLLLFFVCINTIYILINNDSRA